EHAHAARIGVVTDGVQAGHHVVDHVAVAGDAGGIDLAGLAADVVDLVAADQETGPGSDHDAVAGGVDDTVAFDQVAGAELLGAGASGEVEAGLEPAHVAVADGEVVAVVGVDPGRRGGRPPGQSAHLEAVAVEGDVV